VLPGIGDHHIPFTEISLKVNRRREAARTIWLYKRADWEGLADHLQPLMEKITQSYSDVNSLWCTFRSTLLEGARKFIPTRKSSTRPSQPWISSTLDKKMQKRNRLHQKSKKHGKADVELRFRQLKAECQRELRQEHNKYVENILTDTDGDGDPNKRFWKYVKHKRSEAAGIGTLRVGSRLLTSPKEKAEALNTYFQSVFSEPHTSQPTPRSHHASEMPTITVDEKGVLSQLMKLNPHKATGPDDLSPRLMKMMAKVIAPALTHIYQISLDSACVPEDWKMARVCPVFKKGDRYQPCNYRPISLTCVSSKILEHIVTSNLTRYIESNNKLTSRQHGFRSRRSCESQLIELTSDISQLLDDGKEVDACFLDFSKAFDKVDHSHLIKKLVNIGANSQITNWTLDFLAQRSQVVVVDGYPSSAQPVTSGVPQGSVIGPILFLIYINDMLNDIKSEIRLFADDTVIYNTSDNYDILQEDLRKLELWEAAWSMEFNPSKCEHLKFTRKLKNTSNNSYTLHNTEMCKVSSVKYLGVKLQSNLRWNENTAFITGKASSRLGYIRRTIPPSLPYLREKAYKQLARPILEYSCTVWDAAITKTQSTQLESVQRRAARITKNIPRTDHVTSTTKLLEDMGWEELQSRRVNRRIGMFRAMHFGEVATNICDYIPIQPPSTVQTRRHSQQYLTPHCRTKAHLNSFFISSAKLWNALPPSSSLLVGPPLAG
jgi:hypothetical protein